MELTEWVNGVFVILTDFLVFDHKVELSYSFSGQMTSELGLELLLIGQLRKGVSPLICDALWSICHIGGGPFCPILKLFCCSAPMCQHELSKLILYVNYSG